MKPNATNRTAIIGRTGSGKTQFSIWFLGTQMLGPWRGMPVTIIDPKHSKFIAKLDAEEIRVTRKPPTEPGLYVIRPLPGDDDEALKEYMLNVWHQENHGMYFDEILDLGPRNKGFRRLLSQGREKRCPMIYCTQRPSWVDRYAFSEAEYIGVFDLSLDDDAITANKFAPGYRYADLQDYQCYWYSVQDKAATILAPCPPEGVILARYYPEYEEGEGTHYPEVLAQTVGTTKKVLI